MIKVKEMETVWKVGFPQNSRMALMITQIKATSKIWAWYSIPFTHLLIHSFTHFLNEYQPLSQDLSHFWWSGKIPANKIIDLSAALGRH
jgi:hypothetical protein